MINHEIQQEPCETKYLVSNSPYKVLYFDITRRCNMKCNCCYNPSISIPDMSLEYFEKVCSQIPRTVEVRMLGGEPTIHPQIFDFIDIVRKYRHIPTVVSNGKMYSNSDFAKEMAKHTAIYGISLSGGLTSPNIYKEIDNEDSYSIKMKALENLLTYGVQRVALLALIIRDLNEFVIGELINFAKKHKTTKYLKLRSLGYIGRHLTQKPYTTKEFKPLLHSFIPNDKTKIIRSGLEQNCNECCYRIITKDLYISHVEFGSENSQKCWMRGKVGNNFEVEPFFENMVKHGEYLQKIDCKEK